MEKGRQLNWDDGWSEEEESANFMILQPRPTSSGQPALSAASLTHVQPFGFMQPCYTPDFYLTITHIHSLLKK